MLGTVGVGHCRVVRFGVGGFYNNKSVSHGSVLGTFERIACYHVGRFRVGLLH